jgi:hypothetical protein
MEGRVALRHMMGLHVDIFKSLTARIGTCGDNAARTAVVRDSVRTVRAEVAEAQ